ncbi:hypothetical protein QQF54_20540 [Lelliottia sp. V106_10]|uniref:hypothetical protein n=1 Tax=Lelliottia wanjuensis TaxID=3050585 RepID=UPI00254EDC5F|nr:MULTISPECIES: hypothetical protein [unclassified Lelliottia]MDK9356414.1 hypothetical protein [Lelliottia sp. V106_16]MDK9375731.1 hypothetical protein [Lelliottia sp. V106_10]MDK9602281.1 hypothetical protein [Lelliottia sp. V106_5]
MNEPKYFDYLVLGGEHHGKSYNGLRTPILEVRANSQPMARLYARDEPAQITVPVLVSYRVVEHICGDGKHFFIATNDDLTNFDVEEEILKSGISPVN